MSLSRIARPKVNLCLHITGKRSDGYHLLESLVCFPQGGDLLEVSAADTLSLACRGPFAAGLSVKNDNLVLRAAQLLKDVAQVGNGAHIKLQKNLPIASGIGGGSSDAAACLLLLIDLWNVDIAPEKLHEIALMLGADVPACLTEAPLLMRGVGGDIERLLHFPKLHILLVNPCIEVSTPAVFKGAFWSENNCIEFSDFGTADTDIVMDMLHTCRNDLQKSAEILVPEVSAVLATIKAQENCLLARMSGSGATCFGLFKTEEAAAVAKEQIADRYPDWWLTASIVEEVGGP